MRVRTRNAVIVCVLALALTAGIPLAAHAVTAQAAWTSWLTLREIAENPPIIIIGTDNEWTTPDIDGNHAVFAQRRVDADGTGPGTAPGDWNIYVYNLSTREKTAVTTASGDQTVPRISGDWIVYADRGAGNTDVKAYRISTKQTKTVASGTGEQYQPDVSGSLVVYRDVPGDAVRLYNLTTGVNTLVHAAGEQPAISGKRVVFIEGSDIKYKDLNTGSVVPVTNDAPQQLLPRIDGDHIVYMHTVGALDYDIEVYRISSGAKTTVWTDGTSAYPDVSGTIAVWENYGSAPPVLMGYDFMTGKVVTLADLDPTHLVQPKIAGTRVVCTASDTSFFDAEGDIHMGAITAPALSLSAPGSGPYGLKASLKGSLTDGGVALGGKKLDILRSTNGGHTWDKVAETTTTASGTYSYTTPSLTKKVWYRVRYNGETTGFITTRLSRFSVMSGVKAVTPAASVGKPAGYPAVGKTTKTYSVYGSLKPRQTASAASAGVVVIRCYRRESGRWRLRKTVNAKVSDYETYSRYRASVRLASKGSWRLRAQFKGSSTNSAAYGAYRYVKVQ